MRKATALFLLTAVTFISCQKEVPLNAYGDLSGNDTTGTGGGSGGGTGGGTNASLLGTWKFAGMQASTSVDLTTDVAGMIMRTVTLSAYNTIQNTGTYTFTATQLNGSNVGYAIDTVVTAYTYMDGVLQDSTEAPFQMPVTTQNSTSTYTLVGSDSMYFSSGSVTVSSGSPGMDAKPAGAKYKIVGNTLTLSFLQSTDTTMNNSGTLMTVKQRVSGTIKLIK